MLRTIFLLLSPILLSGSVLTYGPTDMPAFTTEYQSLGGTTLGQEFFPNDALSLPGLSVRNCSGPNCASPGLDTISGNIYRAMDGHTWGLYSDLQTRWTLPTDAVAVGFDFDLYGPFYFVNPVEFLLHWSDGTTTDYQFSPNAYSGLFGILSTSARPVDIDFVGGFWNAKIVYVPEGQFVDPNPEPGTIALLGIGLMGVASIKWLKRC